MIRRTLQTRKILAAIFTCVVVSTLLLFGFLAFTTTVFPDLGRMLDSSLIDAIYSLRTPFLTSTFFFVTLLGGDAIVVVIPIVFFLFSRVRHKKESVFLVASVILGVILNNLLKTLFARIRPDISPLMDLHSYSYPSGHAMNAFIFYGLLAYYLIVFTKRETLEVIAAVVSIVIILLVGISRVYLGVHYPTDVIAGYIAGICVVATTIITTSRFYQSGD